eukprot:1143298-Pelagomonas_calceolata.AAC.8
MSNVRLMRLKRLEATARRPGITHTFDFVQQNRGMFKGPVYGACVSMFKGPVYGACGSMLKGPVYAKAGLVQGAPVRCVRQHAKCCFTTVKNVGSVAALAT